MRFTIGRKMGVGFGILLILVVGVFVITFNTTKTSLNTLSEGINQNEFIKTYSSPTLSNLQRLRDNIEESKNLIKRWATAPTYTEHPDKRRFNKIKDTILPLDIELKILLNKDSLHSKVQDSIDAVFKEIHLLFEMYEDIQNLFPNLASYDNVFNNMQARFLIAPDGVMLTKAKKVSRSLDQLIAAVKEDNERRTLDMNTAFGQAELKSKSLINLILYSAILLFIIGIIVALLTTRSITKPVRELKGMLIKLGRGIIPEKEIQPSQDEIGDMSVAMNKLVVGINHTTEFAHHVGQSNFNYDYQPLSEEDTLGHALMRMRDDLAENERILEQKVIERTEEVVRQKGELEKQKMRIEELYKDVTDSIKYAKRLQDSILPPDSQIKKLLPESFVLFKPKDIVSGDFYWMEETNGKIHLAAVDCTGHGVPGAFMSLVGANALDIAVQGKDTNTPAEILNELNRITSESLNKSEANSKVRDGMDLAMVSFSKDFKTMEYAGANNPLYQIRGDEVMQTKADKFAIGSFKHGDMHYTNHQIDIEEGDMIYLFSDGYADQFGGVKGKKFMYRQFRDTLLSIKQLPLQEQCEILNTKIENWRGNYEQIDDILIIGIRV
ncbi:MAG: SpoIIE family protein phosphatase [Flavobacteriales bacterium]|nr:SpoIIE family protein phosphatase [Flavobacteriales bacterium]